MTSDSPFSMLSKSCCDAHLNIGNTQPADEMMSYNVAMTSLYIARASHCCSSKHFKRVGYIPRENLIGRAEIKFFSVDGAGWKFWKWPSKARFSRFFDSIE